MRLATIFRSLTKDDFKLLKFFVKNLKRFEYIPIEFIAKKLSFTPKELDARLRKLHKLGVIERHPNMNAYRLKSVGLDCYALKILVNKGILKALGDKIGVGKESDIYSGLSENDELVAVKFYKIGRTSFRKAVLVRDYGVDFEKRTWLSRSIIAGRREREALKILNDLQVPYIPKLYGGALHAVVINYIEGVELYEVKELEKPKEVFNAIIEAVRQAYWKAKIVHGDLSEFNIIVEFREEGEVPIIIDWPQYVAVTHPTAQKLLERDVKYIVRFFRKKFDLEINPDDVLKYVLTPLN